jgi:hypothetical protein
VPLLPPLVLLVALVPELDVWLVPEPVVLPEELWPPSTVCVGVVVELLLHASAAIPRPRAETAPKTQAS